MPGVVVQGRAGRGDGNWSPPALSPGGTGPVATSTGTVAPVVREPAQTFVFGVGEVVGSFAHGLAMGLFWYWQP